MERNSRVCKLLLERVLLACETRWDRISFAIGFGWCCTCVAFCVAPKCFGATLACSEHGMHPGLQRSKDQLQQDKKSKSVRVSIGAKS